MTLMKVLYSSLALIFLGIVPLHEGRFHIKSFGHYNDNDHYENNVNQSTLRQVTVLMRHGQRAPVDTYPNDPNINSSMAPYGWGQLTNSGRLNDYHQGKYLHNRYDNFLGKDYTPDKFWLQSTSADRARMSAVILATGLWKPGKKQIFKVEFEWQPVVLNYWPRAEDRLLIIWNACPLLTKERLAVENAPTVKKFNDDNAKFYDYLANHSGSPMNGPGDVANLYATLRAEAGMGIAVPDWAKEYYPTKLRDIATFSYSMNSFNDKLKRLAGGPFVKKLVTQMNDKKDGKLKPESRRMFAYVGHDSTLVNVMSAMKVWDGQDPDYSFMLLIELHEIKGKWHVEIFEKKNPDHKARPLTVPGCDTICPLENFTKLMEPVIPENYNEECKVLDPNYVIPATPPA